RSAPPTPGVNAASGRGQQQQHLLTAFTAFEIPRMSLKTVRRVIMPSCRKGSTNVASVTPCRSSKPRGASMRRARPTTPALHYTLPRSFRAIISTKIETPIPPYLDPAANTNSRIGLTTDPGMQHERPLGQSMQSMVSVLDRSNAKHPRKILRSTSARHDGLVIPTWLLCASARELRSRAHVTSGPSGRGGFQDSTRDTLLDQGIQEDVFDLTYILASLEWPSTLLRTSPPLSNSRSLCITE
ncbi:hypothetical protein D0859_09455, partial [Hortaea werneckii]